jgi:hypothetical protein
MLPPFFGPGETPRYRHAEIIGVILRRGNEKELRWRLRGYGGHGVPAHGLVRFIGYNRTAKDDNRTAKDDNRTIAFRARAGSRHADHSSR